MKIKLLTFSVPWIKKIAVPVSKEWTSYMEQVKGCGFCSLLLL